MDKGAHFYCCDLQVHTPRDTNWEGGDCVSDNERQDYASKLVLACREHGLQAIAVTDHHDMAFVRYVRAAAEEETDMEGQELPPEKRLVVFPGMELTLGVPCQALLVFDADFPDDLFSLAMTALTITPAPDGDAKIAPVQRLTSVQSLKQLKEKLDEHRYLRGKYIVFPHVGENGDFSLIRKGFPGKYVEMPCVGGFVDGNIDRLGTGTRNIIAGKAKEWGNKRIACFQTSDNRRENHSDLGRSTTWIKWTAPTAEALRQACLAQESRVSQVQPQLPSVNITRIAVSNSSFLGPFDLEFNPQYSALIGGRGTGKSTILEYLRWALCDQPPQSLDENDTPNYLARRKRLIDQTLKPVNANIEVRFEVNGVAHTVRRDSQSGDLLMKISNHDMRPCSEEEVRSLLPIQAYSQKQLSDVSVRVDELSRFITAPIRAELSGIRRQLDDKTEKIREAYSTVRRRRALFRTLEERLLIERSLSEQAETLRASLTGLSEEDQALLDRGNSFLRANQAVEAWRGGVNTFKEEAESLCLTVKSYLEGVEAPPEEPEKDILKETLDEYKALLSDAMTGLDALLIRARAITAIPEAMDKNSPWRRWAEELAAFRKTYDAAVQRSSTHREKKGPLKTTEKQLHSYIRDTGRVREELKSIANAEETHRSERDTWEKLASDQDDALDAQCAKLTADSGDAIRAHVKRYADAEDLVKGLKQAISGSRVPGSKIEGLGAAISAAGSAEDASTLWKAVLTDLEKLAEFDPERDGIEHRPEASALAKAGLTPANLDGIGRTLNLDDWLTLSLTPIKSEPVFEYRTREQEYIPFRNASAGQQATALLKTLLNQQGPPLIIDQPEEDLDNPVMLEIVECVWEAKQKRQLIFASHNANLVVNGDAELVAWCDYRTAGDQSRGTIAGQGAIDIDDVRNAIKRIMEGGEAAFHLRKEKYGF